jgi:FkbM family methyltransferase
MRQGIEYIGRKIEDIYWHIEGNVKLQVGNVEAVFDSSFGSWFRKLKSRHESEYSILEDLIGEVNPDDVVLDVGASLGLHTCFPAKKLESGVVVAVEPNPNNVEVLRKNISLNGKNNVILKKCALSNSEGKITVASKSSSSTSEESKIQVDSVVGDSLLSRMEISVPNIVKIDVEGAEGLVIDGLRNALNSEKCRLLYCEIHLPRGISTSINHYGISYDEILDRVRSYGFKVAKLEDRGREVFIKCSK